MTTALGAHAQPDDGQGDRQAAVTARAEDPVHIEALTSRQREILALLAAGASSKQVARVLGVSRRTIDKHMEVAYRTLGVTTRIQALRAAGHLDRTAGG